jgi:hypothetical protein
MVTLVVITQNGVPTLDFKANETRPLKSSTDALMLMTFGTPNVPPFPTEKRICCYDFNHR